MTSRFLLQLCLALGLAPSFLSAQSQLSAVLRSPQPAGTLTSLSAPVTLALTGTTDLSRIQLRLNKKLVTPAWTASSPCTPEHCTATAVLSSADGLIPGGNFLSATVTTASGAVATSSTPFRIQTGVGGALGAATLVVTPASVGITTSAGQSVIFTNYPGRVAPVTYPQDFAQSTDPLWSQAQTCQAGQLNIFALDRSNLQPKGSGWSACVSGGTDLQTFLSQYDSTSLIIAFTTGAGVLNPADFTPIGGSQFVANVRYFSPDLTTNVNSFSIIGVPGAQAGSAFQNFGTYYTPSGNVYTPLDGVLEKVVDISGSPGYYVFRQADAPGFTITPGTAANSTTAAFQINYHSIQLGSATPANYTLPRGLALPVTGAPIVDQRTFPTNDGGFDVLFLERHSLAKIAFNFYYTNQGGNPAGSQQQQALLTQDLNSYAQEGAIVLLASNGNALDQSRGEYVTADFAAAVQALGAARYDLTALLSAPSNTFSFIGSLDNLPITSQTYATTLHTQQGETGVLHGLLLRNHNNLFTAGQVVPVTSAYQASFGSGQDLTTSDLVFQLGLTRPVAWPLLDTPGHIAAYQAISQSILQQIENNGSTCASDPNYCDLRVYYSSTLQPDIIQHVNAPPAFSTFSSPAFTQQDYNAAVAQLQLEVSAIQTVKQYFTYTADNITAATDSSVATALSQTATSFAGDLNTALGTPATNSIGSNTAQLISDGLDTVAALAVLVPGAGEALEAVSTMAWLGSSLAQQGIDIGSASSGEPSDPFVSQLSNLELQAGNIAGAGATAYATALSSGITSFEARVFGDWYKLQTLSILAGNPEAPDSNGFFFSSPPSVTNDYLNLLEFSARKTFLLQILPQFYSMEYILGLASNAFLLEYEDNGGRHHPDPFSGNWRYDRLDLVCSYPLSPLPDYSWEGFPSIAPPQNPSIGDYFLARATQIDQENIGVWPSAFGDKLMGPPNPQEGPLDRSLNMPEAWFYSSNILPPIPSCLTPNVHAANPTPLQPTVTALSASTGSAGALQVVAAVAATSGSTPPDGTVTFTSGTTYVAQAQLTPAASPGTATATYTLPASSLPYQGGPLTAVYAGNGLFSSSRTAPFTVPAPSGSFALSAARASGAASGADRNGGLVISPVGGYAGVVDLTCSATPQSVGAPAVACTVTPAQVVLDGSTSVAVHLSLAPTATAAIAGHSGSRSLWTAWGATGVAAASLLWLLPVASRSRRLVARLLLVLCCVPGITALGGCGAGQTTLRTYQVQVRATSGAQVQTASFTMSTQ